MKYDPIELMKMNLTEESIQKMRDQVKDALIQAEETNVVFFFHVDLLPFVIDMVGGYKVRINSCPVFGSINSNMAEITIYKIEIHDNNRKEVGRSR